MRILRVYDVFVARPESRRIIIVELEDDDEFVLYRGEHSNQPGSPSVLLLAPASMQPPLASQKEIEHEYSLRWIQPALSLAVSEERRRTIHNEANQCSG